MKFLTSFKLFEDKNSYHRILDLNYSFKLYKVADKIWCIVAPDNVTLCSTFLRCQEYYESNNPIFQNNKFTKVDYINWYKNDFSGGTDDFRYHLDWAGFNLPSESIEKCMNQIDDEDDWDIIMKSIIKTIKKHESGKWYLLGVPELDKNDISILSHEMAHGMFYTDSNYKSSTLKLISEMDEEDVSNLKKIIFSMGYAETSLVDEVQAYLSTGLIEGMEDFVKYSEKFENNFKSYNDKHLITNPSQININYI